MNAAFCFLVLLDRNQTSLSLDSRINTSYNCEFVILGSSKKWGKKNIKTQSCSAKLMQGGVLWGKKKSVLTS